MRFLRHPAGAGRAGATGCSQHIFLMPRLPVILFPSYVFGGSLGVSRTAAWYMCLSGVRRVVVFCAVSGLFQEQ